MEKMKYKPDIYQESAYDINYKKLWASGIRIILLDLDNTIATHDEKLPNQDIKELIDKIKTMGFKIILFSNSVELRVKRFAQALDIEYLSFVCKPFLFRTKKALQKYDKKEMVIIGDQLKTDINFGNKIGIKTILVDHLGRKDIILTFLNRWIENRLFSKLKKEGILERGKFYE